MNEGTLPLLERVWYYLVLIGNLLPKWMSLWQCIKIKSSVESGELNWPGHSLSHRNHKKKSEWVTFASRCSDRCVVDNLWEHRDWGCVEFQITWYKVNAPNMSQPALWVIRTNKCGRVQLLGQCIVPYETPINCIPTYCIFMWVCAYFVLKEGFSLFDVLT